MTRTTPPRDSDTADARPAATSGTPTVGLARAYRTLPPVARDFVRMTSHSGPRRNSMILRLNEEQRSAFLKLKP